MSATKRPTKTIQVASPTPVRKSPLGKPAKDAEDAIKQGDRPGRGYRTNGN